MKLEPKLGTWYWVAGQGPMQLVHIWKTGNLVMRSLLDMAYFAARSELSSVLTPEVWETYKQQARSRKIAVPDELPVDKPAWVDSYIEWEQKQKRR